MFQGGLDDRVSNFFDTVSKNSSLRPSVLFHALNETTQGYLAKEIQADWRR